LGKQHRRGSTPDWAASLDDGQDLGANRFVLPVNLRYGMVQRLVRRSHAHGMDAYGYRLDALVLGGQQKSRTIRAERRGMIGMGKY
jgi:hypothetical protein